MKRRPRRRKSKRKSKREQLDLESFAAHIEDATREAGFEVEKRDGLDLYVIPHDEPIRCSLKTAYSAYQLSPHRLDDIVATHLKALRIIPPTSPLPTEEEAAQSLLPMLNPAQFLDAVKQRGGEPPVHRPFAAGLIVTYVFDFPHHRAYINQEMMTKMTSDSEITPDLIHEYALENLRKRTTSENYETHGLREQTMVVCEMDDGYAAARVLLPDLMEKWARRIPGRMLIGIPNRDFMIAFSDRDPGHVAAIAGQVRRDVGERDHPLCADLLLWQDGRIREYNLKQ
ncbi:MAG: DUF1444 family protein [Chloroflexota bacterium]|nr:DUF1444 family protein [Chloroflexota bacterium]